MLATAAPAKPVSPFLTDREAGPAVRNIARLWEQCGVRGRTDYRAIRNMLQTCADAWTSSDGRRYWVTFNRAAGLARTSLTDRIIEVSPEPTEDNALDLPSLWAVLTSYLAHETTHDRYWRSFRKAMDEAFGAPGTALRSRAHVYDNLLQDIAGERMFVRDYPGVRGIFRPMLAYIAGRTPHQPMISDRPVNRAIGATRYADWCDWTGCEAERDWWQAWADRWTARKPTPRRWVAAVREALRHDADTQHPEPEPEPQPGGDSITEPGPSTDEPEDGQGGAGKGEPNDEPDEGDEDGEPGAGDGEDEDEDEPEEPGEGGAGTESEDEGEDESEPGAGGEGEDEAEGEPEDGEGEDDGAGTGDGAGTDTTESGESEDEPESEDPHEGEGQNDAQSGHEAGHGDGKVHPESEPPAVPEDVEQEPDLPVCPAEDTKPDPHLRQRAEQSAYVEPDYVERPDRSRWPAVPVTPDARLTQAIQGAFQRSRTGDSGYERGFRSGMLDGRSLHRMAMGDDRLFGRRSAPEPGRFNVYILVDTSGSMGGRPREEAAALSQALANASRTQPNLRLSLFAWASGPVVHIWTTGEPIAWPSGIRAVSEAGGGTEDTRAVRWATSHMRKTTRGEETPILFFLSDGEGQSDLADAVDEARRVGITVVGVSIGQDLNKADVYGADWVPWQGSVAGAAIPLAQIIARAVNRPAGR